MAEYVESGGLSLKIFQSRPSKIGSDRWTESVCSHEVASSSSLFPIPPIALPAHEILDPTPEAASPSS